MAFWANFDVQMLTEYKKPTSFSLRLGTKTYTTGHNLKGAQPLATSWEYCKSCRRCPDS